MPKQEILNILLQILHKNLKKEKDNNHPYSFQIDIFFIPLILTFFHKDESLHTVSNKTSLLKQKKKKRLSIPVNTTISFNNNNSLPHFSKGGVNDNFPLSEEGENNFSFICVYIFKILKDKHLQLNKILFMSLSQNKISWLNEIPFDPCKNNTTRIISDQEISLINNEISRLNNISLINKEMTYPGGFISRSQSCRAVSETYSLQTPPEMDSGNIKNQIITPNLEDILWESLSTNLFENLNIEFQKFQIKKNPQINGEPMDREPMDWRSNNVLDFSTKYYIGQKQFNNFKLEKQLLYLQIKNIAPQYFASHYFGERNIFRLKLKNIINKTQTTPQSISKKKKRISSTSKVFIKSTQKNNRLKVIPQSTSNKNILKVFSKSTLKKNLLLVFLKNLTSKNTFQVFIKSIFRNPEMINITKKVLQGNNFPRKSISKNPNQINSINKVNIDLLNYSKYNLALTTKFLGVNLQDTKFSITRSKTTKFQRIKLSNINISRRKLGNTSFPNKSLSELARQNTFKQHSLKVKTPSGVNFGSQSISPNPILKRGNEKSPIGVARQYFKLQNFLFYSPKKQIKLWNKKLSFPKKSLNFRTIKSRLPRGICFTNKKVFILRKSFFSPAILLFKNLQFPFKLQLLSYIFTKNLYFTYPNDFHSEINSGNITPRHLASHYLGELNISSKKQKHIKFKPHNLNIFSALRLQNKNIFSFIFSDFYKFNILKNLIYEKSLLTIQLKFICKLLLILKKNPQDLENFASLEFDERYPPQIYLKMNSGNINNPIFEWFSHKFFYSKFQIMLIILEIQKIFNLLLSPSPTLYNKIYFPKSYLQYSKFDQQKNPRINLHSNLSQPLGSNNIVGRKKNLEISSGNCSTKTTSRTVSETSKVTGEINYRTNFKIDSGHINFFNKHNLKNNIELPVSLNLDKPKNVLKHSLPAFIYWANFLKNINIDIRSTWKLKSSRPFFIYKNKFKRKGHIIHQEFFKYHKSYLTQYYKWKYLNQFKYFEKIQNNFLINDNNLDKQNIRKTIPLLSHSSPALLVSDHKQELLSKKNLFNQSSKKNSSLLSPIKKKKIIFNKNNSQFNSLKSNYNFNNSQSSPNQKIKSPQYNNKPQQKNSKSQPNNKPPQNHIPILKNDNLKSNKNFQFSPKDNSQNYTSPKNKFYRNPKENSKSSSISQKDNLKSNFKIKKTSLKKKLQSKDKQTLLKYPSNVKNLNQFQLKNHIKIWRRKRNKQLLPAMVYKIFHEKNLNQLSSTDINKILNFFYQKNFIIQGRLFHKFLKLHPYLLDLIIKCLRFIPILKKEYSSLLKPQTKITFLTFVLYGLFDYFFQLDKSYCIPRSLTIRLSGRIGFRKMGRARKYIRSWGVSKNSWSWIPRQYTYSQIFTRYGVVGMKIYMS